jgi:di/tricarboxylate transporter
MDWEVIYVFGVLALTVLLFVGDWLRPDLVAVISLVALERAGILNVEQALAGFASEAVIAIGSLLVIGEGLVQAGVVRRVADLLCRLAGASPTRLLLVSTLWPGLLSGFINIVAAVSVFIPAVRRLARFGRMSPSRLLMPMGTALETTGAAQQLAQLLTQALGVAGPVVVMTALGALAMLLTQPLHNAAVAVVMTPTAITAAEAIGAAPRPFAIAVLVGASASFLLPTGHPAPLLAQGPGAYRTSDYPRFGAGLALMTLAVIALIIPLIWSLEGG